ncbi:RidA family protein [Pseudomaricurvus alkylphenolicus]|uniref:RidA family protein n=1 Tax=Pseudomaricurvus alkylphenolicus TaxID=1306991 RepID=UPI0014214BB5|nr:Rid family hydrolase [Pseudomaricurvus alkylphenolicus]NIB41620.1 RidA family protein [Pseudomaricurvus alkylphenolicus]
MPIPLIFKKGWISGAISIAAICTANTTLAADANNTFSLNKGFESAYQYNMASKAGCLLFIGGLVSIDKEGRVVGKGQPETEAKQIYSQLEETLAAHQLTLKHVVRESFYATDLDSLAAAIPVRNRYYEQASASFPSTVGAEVSKLGLEGITLEMTAIANTCTDRS